MISYKREVLKRQSLSVSQFFVKNVAELIKPICIQVVIKHEHTKIDKK